MCRKVAGSKLLKESTPNPPDLVQRYPNHKTSEVSPWMKLRISRDVLIRISEARRDWALGCSTWAHLPCFHRCSVYLFVTPHCCFDANDLRGTQCFWSRKSWAKKRSWGTWHICRGNVIYLEKALQDVSLAWVQAQRACLQRQRAQGATSSPSGPSGQDWILTQLLIERLAVNIQASRIQAMATVPSATM